jgi:hypothetical protein
VGVTVQFIRAFQRKGLKKNLFSQQAEEIERAVPGKTKALMESFSDPMSVMDKELDIFWGNETAKGIYGEPDCKCADSPPKL